jgi:hypothetical protein
MSCETPLTHLPGDNYPQRYAQPMWSACGRASPESTIILPDEPALCNTKIRSYPQVFMFF